MNKAILPAGSGALKLVSAALLLLAVLIFAAGCADPADNGPARATPRAGDLAPDFELLSVDGETVRLSQFRGESYVLLRFTATWCPPCRAQTPRLKELHEKYGERGLTIVSVNTGEPLETVRAYVEEEDTRYITLVDADNVIAPLYGVRFIPLNMIIEKSGHLHSEPSSALPEEAIAELLEQ